MFRARVIPCLLLKQHSLVKTVKFRNPVYIGDPINTVRIFSDKEVDELMLLDIEATPAGRGPNFQLISEIAGECFMPLTYGGGIREISQIRGLLRIGVEKIVLGSYAAENPSFVREAASAFGCQSVVICIDVKKSLWGGYHVYTCSGTNKTPLTLPAYIETLGELGAGEIVINNIDRDGTWTGFDIDLLQMASKKTATPVVALGGAGNLEHIRQALHEGGASAVAIGSLAVFQAKGMGVLVRFPSPEQLDSVRK